jgi:predicted ATPase
VGALLQRTRAGTGGVLLVDGERGMGKSLLLREARHAASAQGFWVAAGAGDPLRRQTPLSALRTAVGLNSDDDRPDPGFLPLQIGRLREQLRRRAETAPVLVTLDDVQWADQETLLALRVLPRELARYPVAWVLSRSAVGQADDAEFLFNVLAREGASRHVLRPLDTDVVTAMLADAFGVSPDEHLLELAEGIAGNPSLLANFIGGLRGRTRLRG